MSQPRREIVLAGEAKQLVFRDWLAGTGLIANADLSGLAISMR